MIMEGEISNNKNVGALEIDGLSNQRPKYKLLYDGVAETTRFTPSSSSIQKIDLVISTPFLPNNEPLWWQKTVGPPRCDIRHCCSRYKKKNPFALCLS